MLALECSVICILYLLQVSGNDRIIDKTIYSMVTKLAICYQNKKYLHDVATRVLVTYRNGLSEM